MGARNAPPHPVLDLAQWENVEKDDFNSYTDTQLWTKLAADASSAVAIDTGADVVSGVVKLSTAATDNNEAALFTTNKLFSMLVNRPLYVEAMIKLTEGNTDDTNVAFGMASTFGANLLLDDGGGASMADTGALIYKIDGGTVWKASSLVNAGTMKTHTSTKTRVSGSYCRLGIMVNPVATAQCEISYYVDRLPLYVDDTIVKTPTPITHTWDITTVATMALGVYVKAGGTNNEILRVDYIAWQFARGVQA